MNNAVILSGGLGMRLRPFTQVIPKPLLPVGEKAVLEIQIERLKKYGFTNIYLATNYKSDYLENFFGDGSRYGVNLTISKEDEPMGTAGPLLLLRDKLTEPFVMMNGDVLTLIDFKKFYDFSLSMENSPISIAVKEILTPYAFGNIFFDGDYVTHIEEKPNIITYAMAGIYIIKPEIFKYMPEEGYYGMDTLILKLLSIGVPVVKYNMEEYWLDIGQVKDYELAQNVYDDYFKEE